MKIADARKALSEKGLTLKRDDSGDFIVNFKQGREATAYYTNDLDDAYATGLAMIARRELRKGNPMKLKKGSPAARAYMAKIRAMRGTKTRARRKSPRVRTAPIPRIRARANPDSYTYPTIWMILTRYDQHPDHDPSGNIRSESRVLWVRGPGIARQLCDLLQSNAPKKVYYVVRYEKPTGKLF